MSTLLKAITAVLSSAQGRVNAITTEGIAEAVGTNEREVRWHIAEHYVDLCAALEGVLLCSSSQPAGYWITLDSEELLAREKHLWALARKHQDFTKATIAAGLGGMLPKRGNAGRGR